MNNQNILIDVETKPNKTNQNKPNKTRKGNIKIRKVILVEVYGDSEFEFTSTYDASIWYKKISGSTAKIGNISNMMLRAAKGDIKHIGGYFVYIQGINL